VGLYALRGKCSTPLGVEIGTPGFGLEGAARYCGPMLAEPVKGRSFEGAKVEIDKSKRER
jgi:hypothetical protein